MGNNNIIVTRLVKLENHYGFLLRNVLWSNWRKDR